MVVAHTHMGCYFPRAVREIQNCARVNGTEDLRAPHNRAKGRSDRTTTQHRKRKFEGNTDSRAPPTQHSKRLIRTRHHSAPSDVVRSTRSCLLRWWHPQSQWSGRSERSAGLRLRAWVLRMRPSSHTWCFRHTAASSSLTHVQKGPYLCSPGLGLGMRYAGAGVVGLQDERVPVQLAREAPLPHLPPSPRSHGPPPLLKVSHQVPHHGALYAAVQVVPRLAGSLLLGRLQ